MAFVKTTLLKNGATCHGHTVMDELSFGITGENVHYGTHVNPQLQSHIPGGSSCGSAMAVAAGLVDFALGTDTTGCVRIPASFCGVIGYRPSHGVVSMLEVLPNSQSLDVVGIFARDPSILYRVGHVLLQLNFVEPKRARHLIFSDDLFQLSKKFLRRRQYMLSAKQSNIYPGTNLQASRTTSFLIAASGFWFVPGDLRRKRGTAGEDTRVSSRSTSTAFGVANGVSGMQSVLLSSKHLKAIQELLDEVVNVGKWDED
ncbi:hypothetical protein FF1_017419 [Malus domestica]|uniref:outer envelope protein 64, mitochondrial-like n=1 Tax=Malus sylvestris TaxID=3752 RepID=UPI0021ACCF7F|nr:outer envelope protein 64, mitochondrial-like [Malus sylvestris]